MNDLDAWLNFLNVAEPEVPSVVVTQQPEPSPQSLSEQDVDDILGDMGFTPPEEVQAEEITEEPEQTIEDYENSPHLAQALQEFTQAMEEPTPTTETMETIESIPIIASIPITARETTESESPLLTPNSPTLLLDESTTRFSGAEWYNEIQKQRILIAGCGGIGSNLAFQIARMHPELMVLYDDDVVETVNMAGQLYARDDVGKPKVNAIADMIFSYTNMQSVYATQEKFSVTTPASNIMMCGFDSMEARRLFFNAWQSHVFSLPKEEWHKCLYLDGRLSMDTLQVLCITGDNAYAMEEYSDSYLFTDEQADHTVCSMKQTTYLACMIASVMTNLFTNFVANLLDPVIPYDLPFFTEYDAQNMIFKTEN